MFVKKGFGGGGFLPSLEGPCSWMAYCLPPIPPTKYWNKPITMMIVRTAIKSSTITNRPRLDPMVFVSTVCVVFSVVFAAIAGVATRIPFRTGTSTTIRIATTKKAKIAAMMICANARELHSLRVFRST
jgi:hypothetical protein